MVIDATKQFTCQHEFLPMVAGGYACRKCDHHRLELCALPVRPASLLFFPVKIDSLENIEDNSIRRNS